MSPRNLAATVWLVTDPIHGAARAQAIRFSADPAPPQRHRDRDRVRVGARLQKPCLCTTLMANTRTDREQLLEDKGANDKGGPVSGALLLRRSQGPGPVAGLGLARPWSRPLIH